jgi:hypothetical protein
MWRASEWLHCPWLGAAPHAPVLVNGDLYDNLGHDGAGRVTLFDPAPLYAPVRRLGRNRLISSSVCAEEEATCGGRTGDRVGCLCATARSLGCGLPMLTLSFYTFHLCTLPLAVIDCPS